MTTQNNDEFIPKLLKAPTPKQIKDMRKSIKITQDRASNLLHVSTITYFRWETGKIEMPYGYWELFSIKCQMIKDGIAL